MSMKGHILAALHEQFQRWNDVLAGLSEAQISTPDPATSWSIRDEIAHLWAWQQRSIARLEAAVQQREPIFPEWPVPESDDQASIDRVNAWMVESNRSVPWATVQQRWQDGFLQLLAIAATISEIELLDSSRYAWMQDRPLAGVLLATYDHHQEHFDKLLARLPAQSH